MPLEAVDTAGAAFVAGLVTSIHCVGMCGPLGCSLVTLSSDGRERNMGLFAYHGGRILSYLLVGALAGVLGYLPLTKIVESPAIVLPWFLVFALVVVGFGLDKHIPRPAIFLKWMTRLRFGAGKMPAVKRGLALGLATPILPCGPLYVMFGIALVSGSALRGAEFMLAFAMGTIPLLWMAQSRMGVLREKLGVMGMTIMRRSVAVSAALILAWRLRYTLWFVESTAIGCGCH
jgi:sulfite exporter TauE/SafE